MQQMLCSGNIQSEGKTQRSKVSEKLSQKLADNVIKGMRLENATRLALENLDSEFEDCSKEYNFKNRSEGGIPDFLVGEEIVVEVKNWNCEKYAINEYRAFTEIVQRFKNHMDKRKILIISNPKWEGNAKQYVKAFGIEIYELGYFVSKEKFAKAISDIEKLIGIALGYLYRTISSSIKCVKKLSECIKNVFSKTGIIGSKIQKRANQCENRQMCPETIDPNREIHRINSTGFTGNARANGKICSTHSPNKPYFIDCISGLNFTFRSKRYLVKLSSLSLLHTGCQAFLSYCTLTLLQNT